MRRSSTARNEVAANAPVIRSELEQDLIGSGRAMDPKRAKALDNKPLDLASRIGAVSEKCRTTTDQTRIPLYSPALTADAVQRSAQHARTLASARAAIGTIGEAAQWFRDDGSIVSVSTCSSG
jgi:hypothetical protein